jgi:nicotinate dehydrogenase subunit A
MANVALRVNGRAQTLEVDDMRMPLLYALRDQMELHGPKFGCGLGQCGACAVIADGRAIRSCVTPVGTMNGVELTTLEGLGTVERPHPLQQAFIDEQAAQCGFCLNGVILTAKAFIDRSPSPSDAQIQQAMSTVLCRCFTHTRMLRAIARYAKEKKA